MYGIINQSIQQLITQKYGEEIWLKIVSTSQLDVFEFENHKVYDDSYTFILAEKASEELNISVDELLMQFGEYWITDIAIKKYPMLMSFGGNSIQEFMLNLPVFHNRIFLIYPHLVAPEFKTRKENDDLLIEYHSTRNGFTKLMEGMLYGLIKLFNHSDLKVSLEKSKLIDNTGFDLFRVSKK